MNFFFSFRKILNSSNAQNKAVLDTFPKIILQTLNVIDAQKFIAINVTNLNIKVNV